MDEGNVSVNPVPKTNYLVIFLFIISALSLSLAGFLAYQMSQLKRAEAIIPSNNVSLPTSTNSPTLSPTENTNNQPPLTTEYKTTKYGSIFSFEYPSGWHVAELWPTDNSGNTYIIMDPNPISTAPRDGPLGKFNITLINGKPNPDAIFQQEMATFNNQNYTDITKETIDGEVGTMYHYQGKIAGPMMEGEPMENYYFTFNKSSSSPLNQQVIAASLIANKDPNISAMFRHVMLSFKELHSK